MMLAVGTEGCLAPTLPLVAFPERAMGTPCPKEECASLEVVVGEGVLRKQWAQAWSCFSRKACW